VGRTLMAVGEDLDGGGGAHEGGAGAGWCGPQRWRWRGVEMHA
jgi:hypothetical protein